MGTSPSSPAGVVIRRAEEGDLPALVAILDHSIATSVANFHTAPLDPAEFRQGFVAGHERFPWLVAVADGAPVGLAWGDAWKSRCAYGHTAEVSIYLHRDHQGRGLGRALYGRLIPLLRRQGFHALVAGIVPPNPASEALHAALGFQKVGQLRHVGFKHDAWRDVGLWQLVFDPEAPRPGVLRSVSEVFDDPAP